MSEENIEEKPKKKRGRPPKAKPSEQESLLEAVKKLAADPEMLKSLLKQVAGDDLEYSDEKKKEMKIFEVDEKDIDPKERKAFAISQGINSNRTTRPKMQMIKKKCLGCGKMVSLVEGSSIDVANFRCDICLTR